MRSRTFVTLGTFLGTLALAGAAAAQNAASTGGPTFTPLGAAPGTGSSTPAERAVTFTPGGAPATPEGSTPTVHEVSAPIPSAVGGGPATAGVSFSPANMPPNTPYQMDPCMANMPIAVTGNVGPDGAWHPTTMPPVAVGGGPAIRCASSSSAVTTASAAPAQPDDASTPAAPSGEAAPARASAGATRNRAQVTAPADPWATQAPSQASGSTTSPDGYVPPGLPDPDYDEGNPYTAPPASANTQNANIPTPVPPFPSAPSVPGASDGEPNPYRAPAAPPAPPARGGGPVTSDGLPIE